ncbi:MAG: peptidylprolyl isomerase [Elusimicrobia bacterium]|nr:MAG: peptidylprolyl isomerase [Elusimicrobiota bacterium]
MRTILILSMLFCSIGPANAAKTKKPKSEEQKTLYAIGADIAEQIINQFLFEEKERPYVMKGFQDRLAEGKLDIEVKDYRGKIRQMIVDRQQALRNKFLDEATAREGAKRFPTGLIFTETLKGTGEKPTLKDKVRVHYHGTLTNGQVFDSSVARNAPAEFRVDGVIACWKQGIPLMAVGGKAELICPSGIAYGKAGRPGKIPPYATLVFQVELLAIIK